MSDYHRNNRSGHNRYDRNYRSYNNYPKKGNESSNGNMKNGSQTHSNTTEQVTSFIREIMPVVKRFLESNSELQKKLADIAEMNIKVEERKAEAMQNIASALKLMIHPDTPANETAEFDTFEFLDDDANHNQVNKTDVIKKQEDIPEKKKVNNSTSQKLLKTILKLREEGMSFGQVAQHLTSENISTISGKGRWHASTVSSFLKSSEI